VPQDWLSLREDHFRSAISCALQMMHADPLKPLPHGTDWDKLASEGSRPWKNRDGRPIHMQTPWPPFGHRRGWFGMLPHASWCDGRTG
jgi:hypothetical protein